MYTERDDKSADKSAHVAEGALSVCHCHLYTQIQIAVDR